MYSDLTAGQSALADAARFALLAVAVPAVAWLRGRRLARMAPGDEETAEKLWAWYLARGKLAGIAIGIWIGSAFPLPAGAWLPAPRAPAFVSVFALNCLALILALTLLDYWAQKPLKGLTCGLGRFLRARAAYTLLLSWHSILALVILAMPFLYEYSAAPVWYAKFAALVAALAGMAVFYPRLARLIMGPVSEPPAELRETVERVAAQEGIGAPRICLFPDRGAKLPLALAIPVWTGRPAIFISDYLTAELSPEETRSIALHELGHCVKREARARLLFVWATRAGLLIAIPAATTWSPEYGVFFVLAFLICLPYLVRAMRFQRYETKSDLFAAKRAGAEATISALTKIHALALLPRRFKAETERKLSHPGLNRRIAAIRRKFPAATTSPQGAIESSPIRAEEARRRPVTLAVQEDRLVIRSAAPPGAEGAPALVIPADRILAAEMLKQGKTWRLRLRLADEEDDLFYRIGEPELPAARDLIASIDGFFLPAGAPCQFSLAQTAKSISTTSAILGGFLALLGGLPLLITALVNRRRRNIEIFAGYLVASIGAGGCAAVALMSILHRSRFPAAFMGLLCLAFGMNGAVALQHYSGMVQSKAAPTGRRIGRVLIIAALAIGVCIASFPVMIAASALLGKDALLFGIILSGLLWTVAAIAASGPWWPRPSVARALIILAGIAVALGFLGAVYLSLRGAVA